MNIHTWDLKNQGSPLVKVNNRHTEFVTGLDFSLHINNLIASCAWDKRVTFFNCFDDMPNII